MRSGTTDCIIYAPLVVLTSDPQPVLWKIIFSTDWGWRWFQEDSSALKLLHILFILLLHQLHLISSGVRSQNLETLDLGNSQNIILLEWATAMPIQLCYFLLHSIQAVFWMVASFLLHSLLQTLWVSSGILILCQRLYPTFFYLRLTPGALLYPPNHMFWEAGLLEPQLKLTDEFFPVLHPNQNNEPSVSSSK